MGWIISSILFETFEWEMKMNESGEWVGGEMDGSGEWVGGGECVGVENGWEWRMDSPPWKGGVAAPSIELIRSFKRRRRGGQFRLALD